MINISDDNSQNINKNVHINNNIGSANNNIMMIIIRMIKTIKIKLIIITIL